MAAFSTYYDYWENAIQNWFNGKCMKDWSNPFNNLWNDEKRTKQSSDYIPEPWWGNHDCNTELHSVVINFNPGAGGCKQCKSAIPSTNRSSYANDIVGTGTVVGATYLLGTAKWHYNRRAKPILSALKTIEPSLSFVPTNPDSLKHHLSVELIPWHTQNTSSACGFDAYLKNNIKAVYEHSILFAANESQRISNGKLKKVVILRMSEKNTDWVMKLLTEKVGITCKKTTNKQTINGTHSHYIVYQLCDRSNLWLKDIKFVSIWGSYTRNNFPGQADLEEILNQIKS